MPINFPASPDVGDLWSLGTNSYEWDGTRWIGVTQVNNPGITPGNISDADEPAAGEVLSYVNETNFEWLALGALASLNSVNAATITDNSVSAAELNVAGNGTSGQLLQSDGDGSFSWIDATGGGGVPAGVLSRSARNNSENNTSVYWAGITFPSGTTGWLRFSYNTGTNSSSMQNLSITVGSGDQSAGTIRVSGESTSYEWYIYW